MPGCETLKASCRPFFHGVLSRAGIVVGQGQVGTTAITPEVVKRIGVPPVNSPVLVLTWPAAAAAPSIATSGGRTAQKKSIKKKKRRKSLDCQQPFCFIVIRSGGRDAVELVLFPRIAKCLHAGRRPSVTLFWQVCPAQCPPFHAHTSHAV